MNLPQAMQLLSLFMPLNQSAAITSLFKGEEGPHFEKLVTDIADRINAMPVTYQQDGKGDAAIAHLHFFLGGNDWWITEKDMEGDGCQQAFGFACLNGNVEHAEFGYISIKDLVKNNVELDLYFEPTSMGEIRRILKDR
jgi:hypothetical protein